jgi:hypothetical protein
VRALWESRTSAPSLHATSRPTCMEHDDRVALPWPSSTLLAHGVCGSERPPRSSQPLTTKPHHQAFIVPGPIAGQQAASHGGVSRLPPEVARPSEMVPGRLTQSPPSPNVTAATTKVPPSHVSLPSEDSPDTMLAVGGILPLWHTHGSVSTVTATKAPPPCSHVEELQADQAHLPSSSTFSKPVCLPLPLRNQVTTTSYTAAWDTQSSASTVPPSYEAAEDDRMPVLDWITTSTPSTTNIASQVITRSSASCSYLS